MKIKKKSGRVASLFSSTFLLYCYPSSSSPGSWRGKRNGRLVHQERKGGGTWSASSGLVGWPCERMPITALNYLPKTCTAVGAPCQQVEVRWGSVLCQSESQWKTYCSRLEKDGAGDPLSSKRNKESGYYILKGIVMIYTEAVLMIVRSVWTGNEMGEGNTIFLKCCNYSFYMKWREFLGRQTLVLLITVLCKKQYYRKVSPK